MKTISTNDHIDNNKRSAGNRISVRRRPRGTRVAMLVLVGLTLGGLGGLGGCDTEEVVTDHEDEDVQHLKELLTDAVATYDECIAEGSSCEEGARGLLNAMRALDDIEDDAPVFRAIAIADCGGGRTFTCKGADAYAQDGLGCISSEGAKLCSDPVI